MSKIYIHCGLHKTGSTAIQVALSKHAERIKEEGFLYPRAGRIGDIGGHHNIAWQLAGDRRFDRWFGDLGALFAEIQSHNGAVLLSSEDFESSVGHPERWVPLVRHARAIGRGVVLVIYVRNQLDYLESLFQEMLRQGFGDEYLRFAGAVLADGRIRLHEWEFHFDYLALANSLSMIPGVEIRFGTYHSLHRQSPVLDFASVVGLDPSPFEQGASERVNSRDSLAESLTMFYKNRVQRNINPHEQSVVAQLVARDFTKVRTNGILRSTLARKFSRSNTEFIGHFGIPTAGFFETPVDGSPGEISMQKAFSSETQTLIRDLSCAIQAGSDASTASKIVSNANKWFSWVTEVSH